MKHIFKRGNNGLSKTIVLLHGTGGDEYDLLSYAAYLDPFANILSIRGNVLEHGMNRYFRRIKEGVFDQEDLSYRTKELFEFIKESSMTYQFSLNQVILVGYSNGANIASSILLSYPIPFIGAVLHHPMVPFRTKITHSLLQQSILILAGNNDSICPKEESEELYLIYQRQLANVQIKWFNQGHRFTEEEMMQAKSWYETEIMNK